MVLVDVTCCSPFLSQFIYKFESTRGVNLDQHQAIPHAGRLLQMAVKEMCRHRRNRIIDSDQPDFILRGEHQGGTDKKTMTEHKTMRI